jgi:hypothetical protein
MSHGKKLTLTLLLAAAAAGAAASAAQHSRHQTAPEVSKHEEDFYTETTPDAPEPPDPEKRRLRKLRKDRYKLEDPNVDPSRFAITEESESRVGNYPFHAPPEPAIPAAQSDAVVVGRVTDAGAFLAAHKVSVISEFAVSLADVLKADAAGSLTPGASISVVRGGGGLRFPSGKVVRSGADGKPLPRVGRTYLFFLKRNEVGEDFTIITAYELRDGRVFPLDGTGVNGRPAYGRDAYLKFSGADEATFMATVRETLAAAASLTGNAGE